LQRREITVPRSVRQLPLPESLQPEEISSDPGELDPTGLGELSSRPVNTTTHSGKRFEVAVRPALVDAGFEVDAQVRIGLRAGSLKEHVVDFVAERGGKSVLISTKWQNSRGSAEEKVPWEVLCLNHALREARYRAGFLVLGGNGWSLRDYFTSPEFRNAMHVSPKLKIVTLETFMGLLFRDEV
jgi:hypothetical protein